MKKYICVHSHFYQPPRENPWIESIEQQASAYPYHDWNEKIAAECYVPNSKSRILNDKGEIANITNNYENMSFNFGPTLISWMKHKSPSLLKSIQEADRISINKFSGHGNAIAQAYNHMILPLANERDKFTQIYWGIKSFESTFSREPEGMWLPETAVDMKSLEIMASLGIKFTILSPRQAELVRPINTEQWLNVREGKINAKQPYLQKLPSGKSIAIFFYDGPVSQCIAFDATLSGEQLKNKLLNLFSDNTNHAELVNVATDGETFGHHHPFGDMGLAYLFNSIADIEEVVLTNYGEFLAKHPPEYEVRIIENSSWSCIHGIERWRSNCGCKTGQHPDWHQEWRAVLRKTFDWLRDSVAPIYEMEMSKLVKDPWQARNDYIALIEDRTKETLEAFIFKNAVEHETNSMTVIMKWLELQRHTMLMYTSCGWFFEELSGLETTQTIQYAARTLQLADELGNKNLEPPFLIRLREAKSNIQVFNNGESVFQIFVRPAYVDLAKLAAQYGILTLFDGLKSSDFYCFHIDHQIMDSKKNPYYKIILGYITIRSKITNEETRFIFSAIHHYDLQVYCATVNDDGAITYSAIKDIFWDKLDNCTLDEIRYLYIKLFNGIIYGINNLFEDEQHLVANRMLSPLINHIHNVYTHYYNHYVNFTRLIKELNIATPSSMKIDYGYVLNKNISKLLELEYPPLNEVDNLIHQASSLRISLDYDLLKSKFQNKLILLMCKFRIDFNNNTLALYIIDYLKFTSRMKLNVDLWEVQNIFFDIINYYQTYMQKETLYRLGKYLNISTKVLI